MPAVLSKFLVTEKMMKKNFGLTFPGVRKGDVDTAMKAILDGSLKGSSKDKSIVTMKKVSKSS